MRKRKLVLTEKGTVSDAPPTLKRQNHVFNDIPEPIRGAYDGLWRASVRIHFRWLLCKQLFGTDARVALLKDVGLIFFTELQQIMQDDVVLAATRLLDKDNRTLSLWHLLEQMDRTSAAEAVPDLEVELCELKRFARPLFRHRDQRIAHADREVHPSMDGGVLPPFGPSTIETFLERLAAFVRKVSDALNAGGPVGYPVPQGDDGNTLIWNLVQAVEYRAASFDGRPPSLDLAGAKHAAALEQPEGA